MVNYRRVVYEVAALGALLALAVAAPLEPESRDEYNQSQNGTENIRVHVNGVVIAVMPGETLGEMLTMVMPELEDMLESEVAQLQHKPKPPLTIMPAKPEEKPEVASEVASAVEPEKPIEPQTPLSDVSIKPEAPLNKEATPAKQKRPQRLKTLLSSLLLPLMRKNRHQ